MEILPVRPNTVIFVWGVSAKAEAYRQLKRTYGASSELIFMPGGTNVLTMDDQQLADNGLRRLTKDEFVASQREKQANEQAKSSEATVAP